MKVSTPRSNRQPTRSVLNPFGWTLVLAVLCLALFGRSGPAAAQPGDLDPPGRVARLSEVIGQVWLSRPDSGDWVQADRNTPLTTGDRLATEPGARAELQIGSTTVRLDSGSDLNVAALDDSRIALQLQAGSLALRVRDTAEAGPLEVSTPEGRFTLLRAGSYRVDRGSRSSFIGVEAGQVRYEHAASALTVDAGQRGEFWLDANGAAQYALLAPAADAFTAWNHDRDRAIDLAAATRFVSPEMTGAADLVRYGNWEQTPEYGAVWFPTAVAADWAPYSTGRWAWVRPWGWTWVDDAPWGFAPFHYGRWVQVRDRWCWTPGQRAPRPIYAPALVGWVGGGPRGGGSVSIGVGPAVGWFPLAPREVYVPSYRSSPRYGRDLNVNVTNVTNITRVFNDPGAPREFENRRIPHAITVVPSAVLTDRRPVGPAAAQYRDAPWVREFGQRGAGGFAASSTPPIAAPAPLRPSEPRGMQPPPGFAEGHGPGRGFPAERGAEPARPGGPAAAPPPGVDPRMAAPEAHERGGFRGGAVDPRSARPGVGGGAAPVQPVAPMPPQTPAPQPQSQPQPQPQPQPTAAEPGPTRGAPFRPPAESFGRPAPGNVQEGRAPSVPPVGTRPAPTAEAQESPRMRTLPMRRGDDRRLDERRGDDAARPEAASPAPRPQLAAPVAPPPASPAPMRPVEPQRPSERAFEPLRPQERPVVARPPEPPPAARPETVAPRPPEAQSPRREGPRSEGPRPGTPSEPRVAAPERRGESPSNR